MLGVNLGGVVHGIEAFVRGMVERGEPGHVVNTASIGGLVAFPGLAPYTAAKYAVVGLSECLEHDLRAQDVPIGVSVLCPGPVLSSLRENSAALRPGGESGRDVPLVTMPRIPAADVAAQVVDAIRSDRFWILTHPGYAETIRARCAASSTPTPSSSRSSWNDEARTRTGGARAARRGARVPRRALSRSCRAPARPRRADGLSPPLAGALLRGGLRRPRVAGGVRRRRPAHRRADRRRPGDGVRGRTGAGRDRRARRARAGDPRVRDGRAAQPLRRADPVG